MILVARDGRWTHGCLVVKYLVQPCNDAINIFTPVHETNSGAICDLGYNIEGKILKPEDKVARFVWVRKELFCPLQEDPYSIVHSRFVLNKRSHGECIADSLPQLRMIVLILRSKQRLKHLASRYLHLNGIEGALFARQYHATHNGWCIFPTFFNLWFNPYMALTASGVLKDNELGPSLTISPCRS